MPRYFFHRIDGEFEPDTQDTELPNVQEGRTEAVRYAAGTAGLGVGRQGLAHEVTDERGLLLFTVAVLGIDAPATRGT